MKFKVKLILRKQKHQFTLSNEHIEKVSVLRIKTFFRICK